MARAGLSGSEPGADLSAWLAKIMTRLTAKLILIDPLRKYSVQPLCLCRCLYKQPLPNSELAYFSNMCNFRETDVNTSLYFMSALTCRRFRCHDTVSFTAVKVVVHKSNKYSMLKIGSFLGFMTKFS